MNYHSVNTMQSRIEAIAVKRKKLRIAAAQLGILSMSELATRLGCSRNALYFAIERPERFGHVARKLRKLVPAYDL